MAKLPTIKEMAEKVAKEAIERIYAEKPELKEIKEAYEDGFNAGKAEAYDECFRNFCEYDLEYYGEWLCRIANHFASAGKMIKEQKND